MKEQIAFRRYSRTDNRELSKIMTKIFNGIGDERYCEWKYADNPTGIAMSSLAEHRGRIIGQIGIIPLRLYANGREIIAAQEVDVLIEEDYRGLYVLLGLSKIRSRIYAQENIPFCYGFTMPSTSVIGQKGVNFVKLGAIPRLVKVLDVGPFVRKMIPVKTLSNFLATFVNIGLKAIFPVRGEIPKGTLLRRINRFDERFDSFWERIKRDYPIMTARDSAYLNWRYVLPPRTDHQILSLEKEETGQILGFIVLGNKYREVPTGQIVDIITPRNEDGRLARTLLANAIREFHKQKVALVVCWMFPHCHVFPELARLGFRPREAEGRDLVVEITNPQQPDLSPELVLKRESWYITIGDSS